MQKELQMKAERKIVFIDKCNFYTWGYHRSLIGGLTGALFILISIFWGSFQGFDSPLGYLGKTSEGLCPLKIRNLVASPHPFLTVDNYD